MRELLLVVMLLLAVGCDGDEETGCPDPGSSCAPNQPFCPVGFTCIPVDDCGEYRCARPPVADARPSDGGP